MEKKASLRFVFTGQSHQIDANTPNKCAHQLHGGVAFFITVNSAKFVKNDREIVAR